MNPGLSYRESSVAGASPLRLVILLYEQAIEDLRRAIDANDRHDVEGRTREISHALLVIGHLQATLDTSQGGQVAHNLNRFYSQLRSGVIAAQCAQSAELIEQQIAHLILVRDAWCAVERDIAPNLPVAEPHAPSSEWKA
ncbi:MAG TPA: flagellar export chaperone FliS [Candidatus Sulfotelmatobacter sp.]|nr:flagellar export chaperone FliS [Candidatus Sulfotelmatobacter sp.]